MPNQQFVEEKIKEFEYIFGDSSNYVIGNKQILKTGIHLDTAISFLRTSLTLVANEAVKGRDRELVEKIENFKRKWEKNPQTDLMKGGYALARKDFLSLLTLSKDI